MDLPKINEPEFRNELRNSFDFVHLIKSLIRFTVTSKFLIDQIYPSCIDVLFSCAVDLHMADNYAVYCSVDDAYQSAGVLSRY